jgi:nickel transport protein
MVRIFIVLFLILQVSPVAAHSLRLFARVEAGQVSGYAFFIGGGHPSNVDWIAKMNNEIIAQGKTDESGKYHFSAPSPVIGDIIITVNTGEGHIATTRLVPERFELSLSTAEKKPATVIDSDGKLPDATPDSKITERLVEQAVERQVGPLLERIVAMDSRMRLTDVMSGIFLIIGLAGIGLWIRNRRR